MVPLCINHLIVLSFSAANTYTPTTPPRFPGPALETQITISTIIFRVMRRWKQNRVRELIQSSNTAVRSLTLGFWEIFHTRDNVFSVEFSCYLRDGRDIGDEIKHKAAVENNMKTVSWRQWPDSDSIIIKAVVEFHDPKTRLMLLIDRS